MVYEIYNSADPEDEYLIAVLDGPDDVDPGPILQRAYKAADEAYHAWMEKKAEAVPPPDMGKWTGIFDSMKPQWKEYEKRERAWTKDNPAPTYPLPTLILDETMPYLTTLGFTRVNTKAVYIEE